MKSLTGKFSSARGWVVMLILLFGAGLFVAACGDEEVPSPTTPAPPPPAPTPPPAPEPEPAPEPPAVPVGLRISASGMDFIEWSWNAVEGVSGYDVQYSANEAFTEEDETIARTAEEISYRRDGLEAGASAFLRVRAAAGMGEERVTSDWSTHVTGMTAEPEPELPPAPAAPANLRLKDRGSNFIEWEWDEVPGAAGYESQFSTDGISFVALQPHAGAGNTSRRVSNLAAEAAGHLQVRSYTGSGTGADTVRGDWSASDRQTTDEPPAAVALDAPTGLDVTDEGEDSITLEWDSVRSADSYEVGQREPGETWDDASCGGEGNVVEDEECVASGLTEGTDYDFRVKAIPGDTDRYEESDWSAVEEARTEGTAPPEPTTPTSGGMGELNLQWSSDATSITWIWDRTPGVTYDFAAINMMEYDESSQPCDLDNIPDTVAEADDTAREGYESSATSLRLAVSDEDTASIELLCLRTNNPNNRQENLSFAWAVTPPDAPEPATDSETPDDRTGLTKSLTWGAVSLTGGFNYEFRAVADPARDDLVKSGIALPEMQRLCSDTASSIAVVDGETDVTVMLDEVVVSGVEPFHQYSLCMRLGNTGGDTEWDVHIASSLVQEIATRPAKPPSVAAYASQTEVGDQTAEIAWRLAVRPKSTNVPRQDEGFDAKTIMYRQYWATDPAGTDTNVASRRNGMTAPGVDICDEQQTGGNTTNPAANSTYTVSTLDSSNNDLGISTDVDGIVVKASGVQRPAVRARDTTNNRVISVGNANFNDYGNLNVRLCVRAKTGTLTGPWQLGPAYSLQPQSPPPG